MVTDERITPCQIIQIISIYCAVIISKKTGKESIKEGKPADLAILSNNPLKIDPIKINTITVSETIKEGKTADKTD